MKKYLLLLFLIIVLSSFASATGTCALDKYNYHPGETANFVCTCTLPNEENIAAHIVWKNSVGATLQATVTNSGSCRTAPFGDSFLFPVGANYLGNVTFNTTVASWNNAGDTRNDTFNVSGAGANDCVITFVSGTHYPVLGRDAYQIIGVTDGITGNPLVNIGCCAGIIDATTHEPIALAPKINGICGKSYTTVDGHTMFVWDMMSDGWNTDQTFINEYHCWSPDATLVAPDSDMMSTWTWNQGTGTPTTFRSCTLQKLLTTGSKDYRTTGTNTSGGTSIAITIFILLITGVLFFFPFLMDYLKKPISESEYFNLVARRLCYILATFLMILNTSIMANLAISSGLISVATDMWLYLRLFGIVAYILIFYLIFKTVLDLMSIWRDSQDEKRGFR